MQPPKTKQQIESMRVGGQILAEIFSKLRDRVVPGVSELDLDKWVEREIIKCGATVTYKTPEVNFPGAICVSINDEIVHSPPTKYVLQRGDVVSFDLVIAYNYMKVDSAFTMVVGEEPTGAKKHLLTTTERSLYAGIDVIHGAIMTGTIGVAIEKVLSDGKLGIVRELVGHGVGREMHEPPDIPNYGHKGGGVLIPVGATVAIEPMATLGRPDIKVDDDSWTIRTRDGSLAAHFEHTVLITEGGVEILTQL